MNRPDKPPPSADQDRGDRPGGSGLLPPGATHLVLGPHRGSSRALLRGHVRQRPAGDAGDGSGDRDGGLPVRPVAWAADLVLHDSSWRVRQVPQRCPHDCLWWVVTQKQVPDCELMQRLLLVAVLFSQCTLLSIVFKGGRVTRRHYYLAGHSSCKRERLCCFLQIFFTNVNSIRTCHTDVPSNLNWLMMNFNKCTKTISS